MSSLRGGTLEEVPQRAPPEAVEQRHINPKGPSPCAPPRELGHVTKLRRVVGRMGRRITGGAATWPPNGDVARGPLLLWPAPAPTAQEPCGPRAAGPAGRLALPPRGSLGLAHPGSGVACLAGGGGDAGTATVTTTGPSTGRARRGRSLQRGATCTQTLWPHCHGVLGGTCGATGAQEPWRAGVALNCGAGRGNGPAPPRERRLLCAPRSMRRAMART
mmetsp:Transcript_101789/g.283553  ORF Transcript_101789/g.283553 Transcript_101789/m.283553 type:complete len:218 (-) Transcript_101789:111-764(-)